MLAVATIADGCTIACDGRHSSEGCRAPSSAALRLGHARLPDDRREARRLKPGLRDGGCRRSGSAINVSRLDAVGELRDGPGKKLRVETIGQSAEISGDRGRLAPRMGAYRS